MTSDRDPVIHEALERLVPTVAPSIRWDDVDERACSLGAGTARPTGRRRIVVAAAAVLIALVMAVALARIAVRQPSGRSAVPPAGQSDGPEGVLEDYFEHGGSITRCHSVDDYAAARGLPTAHGVYGDVPDAIDRALSEPVLVGTPDHPCPAIRTDAVVTSARPAPPIAGPDLVTGTTVSLAQMRGRPVAVIAWASWCAPCRDQALALSRFKGLHPQVRLLGLAMNSPPDAARRWIGERGWRFASIGDPKGALGLDGLQVSSLPTVVFIDAAGIERGRASGVTSLAELERAAQGVFGPAVPAAVAVVAEDGTVAFPAQVTARVDEVNARIERCLIAAGGTVGVLPDGARVVDGGDRTRCGPEIQAGGVLNASELMRAADFSREAAAYALWQCVADRTGRPLAEVARQAAADGPGRRAPDPACVAVARQAARAAATP